MNYNGSGPPILRRGVAAMREKHIQIQAIQEWSDRKNLPVSCHIYRCGECISDDCMQIWLLKCVEIVFTIPQLEKKKCSSRELPQLTFRWLEIWRRIDMAKYMKDLYNMEQQASELSMKAFLSLIFFPSWLHRLLSLNIKYFFYFRGYPFLFQTFIHEYLPQNYISFFYFAL